MSAQPAVALLSNNSYAVMLTTPAPAIAPGGIWM